MTADPTEPVLNFFEALTARDFPGARRQLHDAGVWHLGGHHELVGDYSADEYVEFLQTWFAAHHDYAAVGFSIQMFGEDIVVAHLETEHGRVAGTASGLMIFRIAEDHIAEGWAIPTFDGGRHPF